MLFTIEKIFKINSAEYNRKIDSKRMKDILFMIEENHKEHPELFFVKNMRRQMSQSEIMDYLWFEFNELQERISLAPLIQ